METTQIYETTVAEPGLGLSFHYVVVPVRSFPEGELPEAWELAGELDLDWRYEVATVSDLPLAIVQVLRDEDLGDFEEARRAPEREFAETLAFGEVVPFELSPLGAESLAGVVLKGGGIAAGAAVGIASGGPTPLLLITVPAGMILCGAAAGVAAALEQGLRQRLLRRLGVEEGQGASAGAAR